MATSTPSITPDPVFGSGGPGVTPGQLAAQQGNVQVGGSDTGALAPQFAPPSQTQDASAVSNQISGDNQGITFPPAPGAPTGGTTANAGIPNPLPSAADIISQGTQQTPAEQQNQGLLTKLAGMIGMKQGQTTLTNQSEAAAGVPALNKIYTDLGNQLTNLNDQATQLQQAAGVGGSIQNKEQQDALGRGITTGGLAPLTAGDLRENQIKQAAIASQALTIKSALYYAQGNLTLAKDAADKAATAEFEQQQIGIDHMNALIAANQPNLTKQEKAQADLVTANLADRQRQLDQQKDDYVSGIGLINAAMKLNGQDPQAQLAIQQAQKLDKNDPQYLQKVGALLSKYQQDPLAVQKQIADLALTRAQTVKAQADAGIATGSQIDPTTVSGWVTSIKNGTAKLSDLTGAKNENLKNAVVAAMAQGGSSATDILNTTSQSLQELQTMIDTNHGFTGAVGAKGLSSFFGLKSSPIPGTAAADFDNKLKQVKNDVILPNLTLLHGLGRVTDREFQALTSAVTSLGTNESEAQFKTDLATLTTSINKKLQDSGLSGGQSVTVNGQTYQVGTVYTDKSGASWTVDANGTWTKK